MKKDILTVEAASAANIPVIQEAKRFRQAVFDQIIALRAGRRRGTACTKTRGEVAGSNAKPWRQKGTGRARAGEKRSPIWRGGGVVFGPRPRSYSLKVNRKVGRAALAKAFSERVINGDVIVVDSFAVNNGKTKAFVALLKTISLDAKTVIVARQFDEITLRAGRNFQESKLLRAGEITTEDLLFYKTIIIVQDALPQLAARMGARK